MPQAKNLFSQTKKFPIQHTALCIGGISSFSIGWCIMYVNISLCSRSPCLFIAEAEHVRNGRPSIRRPTWLHEDEAAGRYSGFKLNTTNKRGQQRTENMVHTLLCIIFTDYKAHLIIRRMRNIRSNLGINTHTSRTKVKTARHPNLARGLRTSEKR